MNSSIYIYICSSWWTVANQYDSVIVEPLLHSIRWPLWAQQEFAKTPFSSPPPSSAQTVRPGEQPLHHLKVHQSTPIHQINHVLSETLDGSQWLLLISPRIFSRPWTWNDIVTSIEAIGGVVGKAGPPAAAKETRASHETLSWHLTLASTCAGAPTRRFEACRCRLHQWSP